MRGLYSTVVTATDSPAAISKSTVLICVLEVVGYVDAVDFTYKIGIIPVSGRIFPKEGTCFAH
jgi:hypothetical protein